MSEDDRKIGRFIKQDIETWKAFSLYPRSTPAMREEEFLLIKKNLLSLKLRALEEHPRVCYLATERIPLVKYLPYAFIERIEKETRKRIIECIGEYYNEDEYSEDKLIKIKETILDLKVLANLHNIGINDFYDFMTPVRVLNEWVYSIDEMIDNHMDNQTNIRSMMYISGKMRFVAGEIIKSMCKGDLVGMIPDFRDIVEANYLRETAGLNPDKHILQYLRLFFKNFLEPSDYEYLDTGFYGDLFTEWFQKQIGNNKQKLQLIWNARCRATDVIDGLIDLEDDVKNKVFSPLVLYIYDISKPSEKNKIENSIFSGKYNKEFEKTIQNYSYELLMRIKNYLDSIKSNSENIQQFKDRTYRIIDLGLQITQDTEASTEYERFYIQSLKELF
ncbi:MAG: hypothetical protein QW423_02515 [Candidatus Aenigmatarchaeota archaeon]